MAEGLDTAGIHNHTIVVKNPVGNAARDMVHATVTDGAEPILNAPDDIAYYEGTIGHTIQWHPADPHPVNYTVYRNSLILRTGTWNSTGETILASVDGLASGLHSYTIVVRNAGGNFATDTVFVTVFTSLVHRFTWHHDCSNLTAFDGRGSDTWMHNSSVTVTFGSINCSGTYFYSDDVGTGTGQHGPLYYHTFGQPFELRNFDQLLAEFEMDSSAVDRRGWIRVGLHAADGTTIAVIQVADPWTGISVNLVYKFSNGTTTETPLSSAYAVPFYDTLRLVLYGSGLWMTYPGGADYLLLTSEQLEGNRLVKYISIQFNGYGTDPLCETFRLHDIKLTFKISTYDIVAPTIDHPSDMSFTAGSGTHQIVWTPQSTAPSGYEIYVNGTVNENGNWTGGSISYDLEGLSPGIYNVTLVVYDVLSTPASDSVIVHVEEGETFGSATAIVGEIAAITSFAVIGYLGWQIYKNAKLRQVREWERKMGELASGQHS
jgi:hypothetical protein